MKKTQIIEEKGLQDVKVFRLCDSDAVAAYSLEEAKKWYKKYTGLTDEELYNNAEVTEIPMDYEVRESEDNFEMTTVGEIIKRYWDGNPFIAITGY